MPLGQIAKTNVNLDSSKYHHCTKTLYAWIEMESIEREPKTCLQIMLMLSATRQLVTLAVKRVALVGYQTQLGPDARSLLVEPLQHLQSLRLQEALCL